MKDETKEGRQDSKKGGLEGDTEGKILLKPIEG